jgi:sugar phosphate isomerase/epimerase
VHLSSGVDVHPARGLPAVVDQLDTCAAAIRGRLGAGSPSRDIPNRDILGMSLWLPPSLAAALAADGRARTRLRAELDARGLEVVTLSGVPYAEGGGEDDADRSLPDWSDPARLEYTLDLARVLVDLLPDDAVRGAVTTLGLGRRVGWDTGREKACARIMGRLSAGLAEVAWQTGRAVRVGFQPEPGYVLDATDQTVTALQRVDRDRIGICLDLANLACTWEDPAQALDRLAAAGISVIRAQLTAAVEASDPVAAAPALREYVRAGGRHQVTSPAGAYLDDLAEALAEPPPGPWRVRHRVPLNLAPEAPLTATTDVWRTALRHLMGGAAPGTEHLDVPTSGWDLRRPEGAEGAAAEIAYARHELESLGLAPPTRARAA